MSAFLISTDAVYPHRTATSAELSGGVILLGDPVQWTGDLLAAVSIDNKVVAITGGARGIGLAIASMLHRRGAKVAIGDIDKAAAEMAGSRLGLSAVSALDVTVLLVGRRRPRRAST
jgi:hypothetical protein